MINLILFGPPGSGKGTQAGLLVDKYQLVHISTGDLFRSELKNDTELGRQARTIMEHGQLVPDEITIGMLKKRVEAVRDAHGFIFDGFPRTIAQAQALDELLADLDTEISGLVSLEVEDAVIVDRIMLRGKTSGRSDDNDAEIIQNRINVYRSATTPVYDFYAEKDKSRRISGVGSIEAIFDRLCVEVDQL